jgi:hypothetical protein
LTIAPAFNPDSALVKSNVLSDEGEAEAGTITR